jgi:hypothetical protein
MHHYRRHTGRHLVCCPALATTHHKMDAAIAAEVAGSERLETRLKEVEVHVRKALLEAHYMLGRKSDLPSALGCPCCQTSHPTW